MWSVFKREGQLEDPAYETADAALKVIDHATQDDDLVIRGWYDVAGLRADADLMVLVACAQLRHAAGRVSRPTSLQPRRTFATCLVGHRTAPPG